MIFNTVCSTFCGAALYSIFIRFSVGTLMNFDLMNCFRWGFLNYVLFWRGIFFVMYLISFYFFEFLPPLLITLCSLCSLIAATTHTRSKRPLTSNARHGMKFYLAPSERNFTLLCLCCRWLGRRCRCRCRRWRWRRLSILSRVVTLSLPRYLSLLLSFSVCRLLFCLEYAK